MNKKQTEKLSLLVSAGLCNSALGFQNNRLPNSQIKASSSYPGLYPYRARLRQNSAWCARYNNHNQYLRIDLRRVTMVTGIATQGRHNVNYWVTQYWLLYSQDNVHWALYRQMSNDKVSHYSHKIDDIRKLSHENSISQLMNSCNYYINLRLMMFISSCFEMRDKLI